MDSLDKLLDRLKNCDTAIQELEDSNAFTEEDRVSTGILHLDRMLEGGLPKRTLLILAARPAQGKTTTGVNLAIQTLIKNPNSKVLFFSMEVALKNFIQKIHKTCMDNNFLMRHPELEDCRDITDFKRISWLSRFQIVEGICKLEEMLSLISYAEPTIVIIDYIQYIGASSIGDKNNFITMICQGLKQKAMSQNCIIIGLTQLNRSAKSGSYKLEDLKDSGGIEQEADLVLSMEIEEGAYPNSQRIMFDILKNRDGARGRFNLPINLNTGYIG